jgi:N-methylhydantoinase B
VPPFALAGGQKGRRNEAIVHYPDGTSEEFAKVTGVHLPKGSRIEVRSGGGAGWGPLEDRTAGEVHADVHAGLLREETARRLYPHAYSG